MEVAGYLRDSGVGRELAWDLCQCERGWGGCWHGRCPWLVCDGQWPATHHLIYFVECAIGRIISGGLWGEELGNAVWLFLGMWKVRMGLVRWSISVVIVLNDVSSSWGTDQQPAAHHLVDFVECAVDIIIVGGW